MSFTSPNIFNRQYGYIDILSHLATSISKRHCETVGEFRKFNLKSDDQFEQFALSLEKILEMRSANAFDIQDLNNIVNLIENTANDQLPYCAHRIHYFAKKVLNSITLTQPPHIIPFIPELWKIISNYAFASYEMPYVTKTLQGWGWKELGGPIPTATVWDVVFQYLGLERAEVSLSIYEEMLKLGDEVLNDYAKIYHSEIVPAYSEGLAEVSDRILHFDEYLHKWAFKKLTSVNYYPLDPTDCDKYWLQRRMLSTRMPAILNTSIHFRNFAKEEEFGSAFFGPILYREIVEYLGKSLGDASILTLSPFLRNLNFCEGSNLLPIEELLTHYPFLESLTVKNPCNKIQIIKNKFLKRIHFRFPFNNNPQRNTFELYVKNLSRLRTLYINHWGGNFRLDVINAISLETLHLSGLSGANRIKLRNVPLLKDFHLSGDIESLDMEGCPNLVVLSLSFKNEFQNPKAYFNISTNAITHLKLNAEERDKKFNFPALLLSSILNQRNIKYLELNYLKNLPEIFLSTIGPQLVGVQLFDIHDKIWFDLDKNCTQLTSKFKSPFRETKDNLRIWSIIQSYDQIQDDYLYIGQENYDLDKDVPTHPTLFKFFKKYAMFIELIDVFPKLLKTIENQKIPLCFGERIR